jgi:hypothetical protein
MQAAGAEPAAAETPCKLQSCSSAYRTSLCCRDHTTMPTAIVVNAQLCSKAHKSVKCFVLTTSANYQVPLTPPNQTLLNCHSVKTPQLAVPIVTATAKPLPLKRDHSLTCNTYVTWWLLASSKDRGTNGRTSFSTHAHMQSTHRQLRM